MKKRYLMVVLLLLISIVGCGKEVIVTSNIPAVETEAAVEPEEESIIGESTEAIEEINSNEVSEVPAEMSTEVPAETENPYNITDCDPVIKYTNTSANIRMIPDKTGDLVTTVALNTELTITGTTDSGWSRIEHNGLVCFIKSSLLSDTKTEVKKPTTNNQANSGSSNGNNQSNTGSSANNSNQSSNNDQANNTPPSSDGGNAGGPPPVPGRGGSAGDLATGGTTGSDNSNSNLGGGY